MKSMESISYNSRHLQNQCQKFIPIHWQLNLPVQTFKKTFSFNGRSFKNRPLSILNLVQLQSLSHSRIIKCTRKILYKPKERRKKIKIKNREESKSLIWLKYIMWNLCMDMKLDKGSIFPWPHQKNIRPIVFTSNKAFSFDFASIIRIKSCFCHMFSKNEITKQHKPACLHR